MRRSGVLYMAASAVFFSGMGALVKDAGHSLPAGQIVLCRVVVTLALAAAMVKHAGLPLFGTRRRALALRGLFGFCALSCFYWTLTHLPLAESTTIQYSAPIFATIGAAVVLKEHAGRAAVVAIVLGAIGTVLVARPDGAAPWWAMAIAVGGSASSGAAYVTVRQLSRTEHPLVIVFYFPLVALPLAIPWALWDWRWPSPLVWAELVAIGVLTQAAQVCLTHGLALEKAGRATAVGYLQVALAMMWGIWFFGEVPTWSTLVGAGLIVGGTLVVAGTSK